MRRSRFHVRLPANPAQQVDADALLLAVPRENRRPVDEGAGGMIGHVSSVARALAVRTRAYSRAAVQVGLVSNPDNRNDSVARLALMHAWVWAFPKRELKVAVSPGDEDALVAELVRAFRAWDEAGRPDPLRLSI